MMNLLMLSTPVLISVVEVAANEQTVNEENAHVNSEETSILEEESTASEEKDVEEGNDPIIKESENEKTEKQSDEVPEEWKGVVFGESTSASRYAIEPLEDGVRLSSTNNGGKFQSSGSDGMTYYYTDIRHFGSAGSASEFGVVRNHVYKVNISNISGFGTPVYDSDLDVNTPERPMNTNTYVAAQVRILSWKVVRNDYSVE